MVSAIKSGDQGGHHCDDTVGSDPVPPQPLSVLTTFEGDKNSCEVEGKYLFTKSYIKNIETS